MFEEVALRFDLGTKLAPNQLVSCDTQQDGIKSSDSLAVVSQTQDRIIIQSSLIKSASQESSINHKDLTSDQQSLDLIDFELDNLAPVNNSVHIVGVRESIKTLAIFGSNLLVVGCSNCLLIYDTLSQTNLFRLNTQTAITAIASYNNFNGYNNGIAQIENSNSILNTQLIACGGNQKVCLLKLESSANRLLKQQNYNAELSSERSTSDTITCLAQGKTNQCELILTGCRERKIRIYQIDLFDENIQSVKLSIEEASQVNCLCPITSIETVSKNGNKSEQQQSKSSIGFERNSDGNANGDRRAQNATATAAAAAAPSAKQTVTSRRELAGSAHLPDVSSGLKIEVDSSSEVEQMNHFAYGLGNEFVGVYRILVQRNETLASGSDENLAGQNGQVKIGTERLWRHRCKHEPQFMLMFDINADGQDELIIGFKSGRLEARAPLTGQLLAATRCFGLSGDRLAGLTVIDDLQSLLLTPSTESGLASPDEGLCSSKKTTRDNNNQNNTTIRRRMLVACSTSGQLVGYRTTQSKARVPLQVSAAANTTQNASTISKQLDFIPPNLMIQQPHVESPLDSTQKRTGNSDVSMKQKQNVDGGILAGEQQETALSADLHIELQGDDTKTSRCETRQQVDLLQQINLLYNEQMELEAKVCRLYQHQVLQTSRFFPTTLTSSPMALASAATSTVAQLQMAQAAAADVNVTHRWDFDATLICLKLTIVISTRLELVDMIRLEDKTCNFLPAGFLLVNPGHLKPSNSKPSTGPTAESMSKSHVLVVPLSPKRNEATTLQLQVFCAHATDGAESPLLIYEKRIEVPKFSMFVSETEIDETLHSLAGQESHEQKLEFSFKLKNQAQNFQTRDWLQENFLCLRFGQLGSSDENSHINNSSPLFYEHSDSRQTNLAFRNERLASSIADDNLSVAIGRNYDTENHNDDELGLAFELKLVDIRGLHSPSSSPVASTKSNQAINGEKIRFLQVKLATGCLRILIEFNGSGGISPTAGDATKGTQLDTDSVMQSADLAMDLIQLLVIDRLQFELSSRELAKGEFSANVSPILLELDSVRQKSRQMDESERRIQSELYESADYTHNLMQQFAIANQLNEFSIAKELLNELSMLLTGAQNAAKTHSLNTSSRLELTKRANELEAKLSFLTGRDGG